MKKKPKYKLKKSTKKNNKRSISRKIRTISRKIKKDGFNGHYYLSPNSGLYLSPVMMDPFRDYIDEIDDKSIRAAREMSILNLFLDPPYKKKPAPGGPGGPGKGGKKKTPGTDSLITKNKDENKTPKTDSLITKKSDKKQVLLPKSK